MAGTVIPSSSDDFSRHMDNLHDISYALTERNFNSIKFLITEDLVPLATLEDFKNPGELLDHLQEHDLYAVLRELLYTIGRYDILRRYYKKDKRGVEVDLANHQIQYISPYRKLLHTICEELDSNAVGDLKRLCSGTIARGILQQIKFGYELFQELDKKGMINKDEVEFLKTILTASHRTKLAKIVEKYQELKLTQARHVYPAPHGPYPLRQVESQPTDFMATPPDKAGYGQVADHFNHELSYEYGETVEDGTRVSKEQLQRDLSQITKELAKLKIKKAASMQSEYCMSSSPRGHCIIINNMDFTQKKFRKGSEVDHKALKACFSELNFVVHGEQDLTEEEVENFVYQYRDMDHSKYDCFAVCVLSHGVKDHFFCKDDKAFPIQKLMLNFSAINCPTLAGKPKLFFIQACQGRLAMPAASVVDDVEIDGDIPDMTDMVLAQSTFPGHVAFRNKEQGSWFMTTLCDVLYQCHTDLHLMDMLIEVNRRVAEAKAKNGETFFKQCPAPVITLRKAVWFRSNAVVCQPCD